MRTRHILPVIAASLMLLIAPAPMQAQNNLTSNDLLYHAFRVPQSNAMNPAFFPRNNNGYLSLPGIGLTVALPISYNELGLRYDPVSDKSILHIDELLGNLSENNRMNYGVDIGLFGFGLRTKRILFSLSTSLHLNTNITLPTDAFNALTRPTKTWVGRDNALVLASDDLLTLNAYSRTSIGIGYEFPQIPLTIGGRINILNGIANVNTNGTRIALYSEDEYYSRVIADVDYRIHSAGIASLTGINSDSAITVEFNGFPNNYGCSFDLGAKYDIGDLSISAAIIDFGPGIHWKQGITDMHPNKGSFSFDGFNLNSLISGGEFDTSFARVFMDTLTTNLSVVSEENAESYWYAVPTKIRLGASYTFLNHLRAGCLFHGQWDKGIMHLTKGMNTDANNPLRYNFTLTLGASLFDWAELTVGNSFVSDGKKNNSFNPGIGLVLTPFKVLQIYYLIDYMSSIYLADVKSVNFSFGINMLLGDGKNFVRSKAN